MRDESLEFVNELPAEKRAQLLATLVRESASTRGRAIEVRPDKAADVPVSRAQQRLWILAQLQAGGHAYNEAGVFLLRGAVDATVLERSINAIVARHEALRTTFVGQGDGAPLQRVRAELFVPLRRLDLSGKDAQSRSESLARLADDEGRFVFDLSAGPLIRVALATLGTDEHVLVLTVHHIVFDGWSIGIFERELGEFYTAFSTGTPPQLAHLPVQYADYAAWQRGQFATASSDLEYWTEQLRGLPPILELPIAKPRPALEGFRGARHTTILNQDSTRALRELARSEDATLFMVLMSGFQALIHRLSHRDDVPVATSIANRTRSEVEGLIGFFVNTLVIRGDLSGSPTFRELLRRIRRTTLDAFEHSALPFDELVAALRPERTAAANPLFQIELNFQNVPDAPARIPGVSLKRLEIGGVAAKYDLTLSLEETPAGLSGVWEYNTDLFSREAILRLAGYFETLLASAVATPELPVSELELLPEPERERLLSLGNHWLHLERNASVVRLIEERAARQPEAPALIQEGRYLSYRELNGLANRLAQDLRRCKAQPNTFVAVALPTSIDAIVAQLAVLKSGAAFIPIDPKYPRAWQNQIIADARPVACIVDPATSVDESWASQMSILSVASAHERGEAAGDVREEPHAQDLAYVIYTSGSTGKPKGVMISHDNLNASTTARWRYYLEPVGAYLLLSSLAFDSSVAGIYWTLTQGGALIMPPAAADVLDTGALTASIEAHRITHLLAVPALYSLILDAAGAQQLASLRTVVVAGEVCPPRLVEQHLAKAPGARLFNEYGPTEGTVWATVHECSSSPAGQRVPIGRPTPHARVYILDGELRLAPIGVPGELHIAGSGVARGYLNESALTAEKFVEDPFSAVGGRLYKTGDRARWRPDGTIEFFGRSDRQVKVRGHRVELAEIEAVLLQQPAVREGVVISRDDVPDGTRILAYVTLREKGVTEALLQDDLRTRLAPSAVPSRITILEALPKLPNGKVDAARLPAPTAPVPPAPSPAVGERSGLEVRIATIWEQELQLQRVGLDDNFFAIGGTSLSIIRVFNRLKEFSGPRLTITSLFKHQTVRSLVQHIEGISSK